MSLSLDITREDPIVIKCPDGTIITIELPYYQNKRQEEKGIPQSKTNLKIDAPRSVRIDRQSVRQSKIRSGEILGRT